ncbi:MAG: threonine/serine exporter family protein [Limnochordia bacterium]|jgi:uncharacterized membrane protein YjjB (DUF3815 family)|nr:threonine/serine exporter family protein [Limnochordia bacterium]
MDYLIQLLLAGTTAIGFGQLYGVPRRLTFWVAVPSALGWLVIIVAKAIGASELVAFFASSTVIGISGELMARRFHAPASLFIIPGIFVLVPGANAYQAMLCFIQRDYEGGVIEAVITMLLATAIAMGLIVANAIIYLRRR